MKFTKWVFRLAGIWGILILLPIYFLENQIGIQNPPAITHPEYFYGFVGAGLAFQLVFLMIATDPVKYRLFMLASMVEKFSFFAALLVLHFQNRLYDQTFYSGWIDLAWGLLFVAAFLKTPVGRK
jgi:hypothetical protein